MVETNPSETRAAHPWPHDFQLADRVGFSSGDGTGPGVGCPGVQVPPRLDCLIVCLFVRGFVVLLIDGRGQHTNEDDHDHDDDDRHLANGARSVYIKIREKKKRNKTEKLKLGLKSSVMY